MPEEYYDAMFGWVLRALLKAGLLKARALGLDAATLEAAAAMLSIVRRDSGESYSEYLQQLAREDGDPAANRRYRLSEDRTRKKKASN